MAARLATGTVPLKPADEAVADFSEPGTIRAIFAEEGWT